MTELLAGKAVVEPEAEMATTPLTGGAALLAILVTALWGTNPTALKVALQGFPPIGASGLRFAIAAVGVWGWSALMGVRVWPRRGEGRWLLVTVLFFIAQIATFTLGVYWGTASHSVVLLHTYPFFVVLLAHFLIPGERVTAGKALGAAAAFFGVAALFGGEWGRWAGSERVGDSVQLASALLLGGQVVWLKHAVARVDPNRLVLWQMAGGSAAMLAYSLGFESLARSSPGAAAWTAVGYQGIAIGALCFTIWTWLIRRHAASRVAIFGFVAPLVGVGLSAAALGEPMSPGLLASMALVAAGLVLASRW